MHRQREICGLSGVHRALVTVAILFLVSCATATPGQPEAKLLLGFEGDENMSAWGIPDGPDRAGPDEVRWDVSDQWASTGERSLKLIFEPHQAGEPRYRCVGLDFKKLGVEDMTGWHTLEFDVHHAGPAMNPLKCRVDSQVTGSGYYASHVMAKGKIPGPGSWRVRMPLRANTYAGNPDRSRVAHLLIASDSNPDRIIAYIDDVRLVDYHRVQLDGLIGQIEAVGHLAGQMGAARLPIVDELNGLGRRLAKLRRDLDAIEPGPQREHSAVVIRRMHEHTLDRLDTAAHEVAKAALASVAPLVPTRTVPFAPTVLQTSGTAEGTGAAQTGAAGDTIGNLAAAVTSGARRKTRIGQAFAGADFAIGIPAFPRALTDRPASFSGPFARRVHLHAARHEYEPFQLVIVAPVRSLHRVRVRATPLEGPAGAAIGAEHIEVAPMGWRTHEDGRSWAEMLRPDVETFDVPAGGQQPVWINLYVPPDAPAGAYEGRVTVEAGDARSESVQVRLTVWPFRLPDYAHVSEATHGWKTIKGSSPWAFPSEHPENAKFFIARRLKPSDRCYHNHQDPIGARLQVWDAGLRRSHYQPGVFSGEPYGDGLHPPAARVRSRYDNASVIRRGPGDLLLSTIALECWREAREDVAYLNLLRRAHDQLAARAASGDEVHEAILRRARRLVDLPGLIPFDAVREDPSEGITIGRADHEVTMRMVLALRETVAQTIVAIHRALQGAQEPD